MKLKRWTGTERERIETHRIRNERKVLEQQFIQNKDTCNLKSYQVTQLKFLNYEKAQLLKLNSSAFYD